MWWFTPSEERTMARRQKGRRGIAQQVARDAGVQRLAPNNARLIATALAQAAADEALFERLYGEPMPAPLRIAVHLEVYTWTLLQNTPNNDKRLVQRRATMLNKLLTLEREMLHTPLTRRYEAALDRVHQELKAGQ